MVFSEAEFIWLFVYLKEDFECSEGSMRETHKLFFVPTKKLSS